MINYYVETSDTEKLEELWNNRNQYLFNNKEKIYETLISYYSHRGQFSKVSSLIKEMKQQGLNLEKSLNNYWFFK